MEISDKAKRLFLEKVDKKEDPNACWDWIGYLDYSKSPKSPYGKCRVDGSTKFSHRVAYVIANGPIPRGKVVRHLCHNSKCCNPRHLAIGSHRENSQDKIKAGRQAKGMTNGRKKLTESQVILMRYCEEPHSYFGKLFGVDNKSIYLARTGKTWAYLNDLWPPQPERYLDA